MVYEQSFMATSMITDKQTKEHHRNVERMLGQVSCNDLCDEKFVARLHDWLVLVQEMANPFIRGGAPSNLPLAKFILVPSKDS